jgi:hypothetical protein
LWLDSFAQTLFHQVRRTLTQLPLENRQLCDIRVYLREYPPVSDIQLVDEY